MRKSLIVIYFNLPKETDKRLSRKWKQMEHVWGNNPRNRYNCPRPPPLSRVWVTLQIHTCISFFLYVLLINKKNDTYNLLKNVYPFHILFISQPVKQNHKNTGSRIYSLIYSSKAVFWVLFKVPWSLWSQAQNSVDEVFFFTLQTFFSGL